MTDIKYKPYGLLVGYMTEFTGARSLNRIHESTKKVLGTYKKRLINSLSSLSSEDKLTAHLKQYYNPKFFSLWGAFDIGFITAIDDFNVLDYLHSIEEVSTSQYQVGYVVDIDESPFIFDIRKELLSPKGTLHSHPLIGISQLKISNFLKLATQNEIKDKVLLFIKETIKKLNDDSFKVCLVETLNWNEFTLLVFSKSYKKIAEIIMAVREQALTAEYESGKTIYSAFDNILERDSFILKAISPDEGSTGDVARDLIKNLHLFTISSTTLGYDFNIQKALTDFFKSGGRDNHKLNKSAFSLIDATDIIVPFSSFAIKPGHIWSCNEAVKKYESQIEPLVKTPIDSKSVVFIGKSDFPANQIFIENGVFTKDFIKDFVCKSTELSNLNDLSVTSQINSSHTTIGIPSDIIENEVPKHGSLNQSLNKLKFDYDKNGIDHFFNEIRRLGLGSLSRRKLYKTISLFNSCVVDPHMFESFMELWSYIERILFLFATIEKEFKGSSEYKERVNNLARIMVHGLERFDRALTTRLSSSYRSFEIDDFSSDGLGGMHTSLSAMDGFLKCQQTSFPPYDQAGFVYFSSSVTPKISSCLAPLISMSPSQLTQLTGIFFVPHELFHYYDQLDYRKGLDHYRSLYEDADLKISSFRVSLIKDEIENISKNKDGDKDDDLSDKIEEVERHVSSTRIAVMDTLCDIFAFNFSFMQDFELFAKCFWVFYAQSNDEKERIIDFYVMARFVLLLKYNHDPFRQEYYNTEKIKKDADKLNARIVIVRRNLMVYSSYNNDMFRSDNDDYWRQVLIIMESIDQFWGGIFHRLKHLAEPDFYLTSKNFLVGVNGANIDERIVGDMLKGSTISDVRDDVPAVRIPKRFYSSMLMRAYLNFIFKKDESGNDIVKRIEQNDKGKFIFGSTLKKPAGIMIDREGRLIVSDPKRREEFFLIRLSLINSLVRANCAIKWEICNRLLGGEM